MCELLALNFALPTNASFSFHGFRSRGGSNPDGWGFAYFDENRELRLIKEHRPQADRSELARFIELSMQTGHIFLSHVRQISRGSVSYADTQPFYRVIVRRGKKQIEEWVFAHNGTLSGIRKALKTGRFTPTGRTDSEFAFCHMMHAMTSHRPAFSGREESFFSWLHKLLRKMNNHGKLNCIFSNGHQLYCYFDRNGYKGLSCVHRKAPFAEIRLRDEDMEVRQAGENDEAQQGYVIATHPLTIGEKWESFAPGELKVFQQGEMIWSSGQ